MCAEVRWEGPCRQGRVVEGGRYVQRSESLKLSEERGGPVLEALVGPSLRERVLVLPCGSGRDGAAKRRELVRSGFL